MKIYVASSWKTINQPEVVELLRTAGYDTYDFRCPEPGNTGFSWAAVGLPTGPHSAKQTREILRDSRCTKGFRLDMSALEACDVCVLLQPSGRSAHLELGWAAGAGKGTIVFLQDNEDPDLMYKMVSQVVTSNEELLDALKLLENSEPGYAHA
jgi:hypothetical protein